MPRPVPRLSDQAVCPVGTKSSSTNRLKSCCKFNVTVQYTVLTPDRNEAQLNQRDELNTGTGFHTRLHDSVMRNHTTLTTGRGGYG